MKPNTISLPEGPGSIEGMGESFEPSLNDGSARYAVPIAMPPGTAGHAPELGIRYESGGGNGPLGFGWSLGVPAIQRQTDKGIPRYVDTTNGVDDDLDGTVDEVDELDTFLNDQNEEMVPLSNGYYFAENESAFIRYVKVGQGWEGQLPSGGRLYFGTTPNSKIQNPNSNTFRWLLDRETDISGNEIRYSYTNFPGAENTNQLYLSKVTYGPGAAPWSAYHFAVFQYGTRTDWIEDGRAGFIMRTGKRLTNVVVGTQGIALPGHLSGDYDGDGTGDSLNRSYALSYLSYAGTNTHWSFLERVRMFGTDGTNTLPAMTFSYEVCDPPANVSAATNIIGGINEPSASIDNPYVDLLDVNGDALPDLLKTANSGGAHIAYLNEGVANQGGGDAIRWSAGVEVASPDGLAWNVNLSDTNNVANLSDQDGDGLSDLWFKSAGGDVYYFKNQATNGWGTRRQMTIQDFTPPAPFGEPGVMTADMDFDKRMDIVQSIAVGGGADYRIWYNLGDQRYSLRSTAAQSNGYDLALSGIELTDFNGDRVPDLTRIRASVVEMQPGMGHGVFGVQVSVPIVDWTFSNDEIARAKLRDLTGDGLPELVLERAAPGVLWYWINLGNNTFSGRRTIAGLPTSIGQDAAIRWADINGNGTTDLIYSDSTSSPRIQAVDIGELIGCGADWNLLKGIDNGIGLKTRIEYESSTAFLLADKATTNFWPDTLPFPVSVVSQVVLNDSLGHEYTNDYRYHDGYYDSNEKEFRGFARAEAVNYGDATAPTLVSKSYFDTGRDFEAMKGKVLRVRLEELDGDVFSDESLDWANPPRTLYTGINTQTVRFAHRTGSQKTIKELGQGAERKLQSASAWDNYGNQLLDANYGVISNATFDDERIVTNVFAINEASWLVRFPYRTLLMDENGVVLSKSENFYDDPTFAGANGGVVNTGRLTLVRGWHSPAISTGYVNSIRTQYDSFGNPLRIFDPLAQAPGGVPNPVGGHYRELAFDAIFKTLPIQETIHVGNGSAPLLFQAAYDVGLGVLSSATEFNGYTTAFQYDSLGRLSGISRPGDDPGFPSAEYTYAIGVQVGVSGLVNFVETRMLDKAVGSAGAKRNHYLLSRTFIDGMGRSLMSKQEAGTNKVAVSGAVTFNTRGKPVAAINPYFSLSGADLEAQLGFEDVNAPGWMGSFQSNGVYTALGLGAAHKMTMTYDATMRERTMTNPDGTFSRVDYEPLITRNYDENDTDPGSPFNDTPMVYHNDGLGRLVQVDEVVRLNDDGTPSGSLNTWATKYGYDLNDQLMTIFDSQNNLKSFAYDGLKRKTYLDDPNRGKMWFVYDDASNLRQTTDAKTQVINYTYDGVNRITSEDYLDAAGRSPDVSYVYDHPLAGVPFGDGTYGTASNTLGRLAYVLDLSGEEHTSYDLRGRESYVTKRIPDLLNGVLVSYSTRMSYDPMDRLSVLTYPDNDQVKHEYDNRGLLRRIYGDLAGNIISNKDYHADGRMALCDYGNGVRTSHAFDNRMRLSELFTRRLVDPTNALLHFGYSFDESINITRIDDLRSGGVAPQNDPRRNTQLYQYDDLNRLTRAQYSFNLPGQAIQDNGRIHYRYDRIGNMLSQTSTINQLENNLPVANLGVMNSGGAAGRFNRVGRNPADPPGPHALTSIQNPAASITNRLYNYDANGNMLVIDGLNCTWDFKDRLVVVSNAQMVARYTYDYTDRRITKYVVPYQPGTTNQELTTSYPNRYFEVRELDEPIKYVWDSDDRVARITANLSETNSRIQRFRINAGWNLLSMAVSTTNTGAQLGIGTNGLEYCFRYVGPTQEWVGVSAASNIPVGSVFWIKSASNQTLQVRGNYSVPTNAISISGKTFLASIGLQPISATALGTNGQTKTWSHISSNQIWQVTRTGNLARVSLGSQSVPVGRAIFVHAVNVVTTIPSSEIIAIAYYSQDHLSSASLTIDKNGLIRDELSYLSFGAPRNRFSVSPISTYYNFGQKERDCESGLSYFEARSLSVMLARFIEVDPLAVLPGSSVWKNPQGLNSYSYSINGPISYHDPNGESFTVGFALAGAAFGAATALYQGKEANEVLKAAAAGALVGAVAGLALDTAGGSVAVQAALTGFSVGSSVGGGIALLQGKSASEVIGQAAEGGLSAAATAAGVASGGVLASSGANFLVGGASKAVNLAIQGKDITVRELAIAGALNVGVSKVSGLLSGGKAESAVEIAESGLVVAKQRAAGIYTDFSNAARALGDKAAAAEISQAGRSLVSGAESTFKAIAVKAGAAQAGLEAAVESARSKVFE